MANNLITSLAFSQSPLLTYLDESDHVVLCQTNKQLKNIFLKTVLPLVEKELLSFLKDDIERSHSIRKKVIKLPAYPELVDGIESSLVQACKENPQLSWEKLSNLFHVKYVYYSNDFRCGPPIYSAIFRLANNHSVTFFESEYHRYAKDSLIACDSDHFILTLTELNQNNYRTLLSLYDRYFFEAETWWSKYKNIASYDTIKNFLAHLSCFNWKLIDRAQEESIHMNNLKDYTKFTSQVLDKFYVNFRKYMIHLNDRILDQFHIRFPERMISIKPLGLDQNFYLKPIFGPELTRIQSYVSYICVLCSYEHDESNTVSLNSICRSLISLKLSDEVLKIANAIPHLPNCRREILNMIDEGVFVNNEDDGRRPLRKTVVSASSGMPQYRVIQREYSNYEEDMQFAMALSLSMQDFNFENESKE